MCGICGKVNLRDSGPDHSVAVRSMSDRMVHRGPDDAGIYSDSIAALGHRRLSIIDLSAGKQPLGNEDGTVWIVFNGEIYNYVSLRNLLIARGHRFRTATDTEVIVHLYEEFGDSFLSQLDGMFAFAIWDSTQRRLLVARDRVGIKPLYYTEANGRLLFASELKALVADPDCRRERNHSVIAQFLSMGYSSGRETPFTSVFKLEPGHFLKAENGKVSVHQYWDLAFPETPRALSFNQARDELNELLDRTVRAHMMSDVPIGVLLSGGVDSSGILALATRHQSSPIHAFTIGFTGHSDLDERPYARISAQRFDALHHEVTIGSAEFIEFLPKYVWHMEELVCEPPAIALYFVTKLARDHGVKVVLSGEGGDEAFAGYNTYPNQLRLNRVRGLPKPLPQIGAQLARYAGQLTGNRKLTRAGQLLSIPAEQGYAGRTADSGSYFSGNTNAYAADYSNGEQSGSHDSWQSAVSTKLRANVQHATALSQMLYIDTKTWLPDDLLLKADKMTMANSVELRVPLLDHHIMEFAAGLPDSYKLHGNRTKHILKEALKDSVPREILNRPKAGFPVPVARWLRSECWDFVSSHLSDTGSSVREYVNDFTIQKLLKEHREHGNRGKEVFSLLTLELWHRQFVQGN